MHEISIVEGVLKIIDREKEKHHFKKVLRIEITCGQYNCISEDNLNFCLETVTKSTYLEGAKFKIHRLPEGYRCLDCNTAFEKENGVALVCPGCHSGNTINVPNNEMYLSKLEVE